MGSVLAMSSFKNDFGLPVGSDGFSDAKNAYVIPAARNINKGNRQIAHGVSAVLRPSDL